MCYINQMQLKYSMKMYRWTRDTLAGGLFNEREGLWWRDKDFVAPYQTPDGKNCYWSRGNGWVYAALVRCMNQLSPKDQYYKELKKDFLLMSSALKACQRPEDGLWNPSLVSYADFGGKEAYSLDRKARAGCRLVLFPNCNSFVSYYIPINYTHFYGSLAQ